MANTLTLLIYNKCDISSSLSEVVFKHTLTSHESTLHCFRFRKMTSLATPLRIGIFNKVPNC